MIVITVVICTDG